jgi:hypothetical protein
MNAALFTLLNATSAIQLLRFERLSGSSRDELPNIHLRPRTRQRLGARNSCLATSSSTYSSPQFGQTRAGTRLNTRVKPSRSSVTVAHLGSTLACVQITHVMVAAYHKHDFLTRDSFEPSLTKFEIAPMDVLSNAPTERLVVDILTPASCIRHVHPAC